MTRVLPILFVAFGAAACAGLDGSYEPSCPAYEGDRIRLQDGRFEWRRFSDERHLDDKGNAVDPFPGFPKTGKYEVDAGRIVLTSDAEVSLDDWFFVEYNGETYLLSDEHYAEFLKTKIPPTCALKSTVSP